MAPVSRRHVQHQRLVRVAAWRRIRQCGSLGRASRTARFCGSRAPGTRFRRAGVSDRSPRRHGRRDADRVSASRGWQGRAPHAIAVVVPAVRAAPLQRMGASPDPRAAVVMSDAIDTYIGYLRDVRRMSGNTISSYARDLNMLAAFAERKGRSIESLERRDLEALTRELMTGGL